MGILSQQDLSNIIERNNEQQKLHNFNQDHDSNDESQERNSPIVAIRIREKLEEEYWLWSRLDRQYYQHLSQGNKADFAPCSEMEFQLVKYLKEEKDKEINPTRIIVEQILSYRGVMDIYSFLSKYPNYVNIGYTNYPNNRNNVHQNLINKISSLEKSLNNSSSLEREQIVDEIIENAKHKRDEFSQKTIELIGEFLGRECGNIALQILSYGGFYLVGDFFTKIQFILEENERFINAFTQKGRMDKYMKDVPVYLQTIVTN